MMAAEDIFNMSLLVADRFNWDYLLIESMPISKLIKWYDGIISLIEMEKGNGK